MFHNAISVCVCISASQLWLELTPGVDRTPYLVSLNNMRCHYTSHICLKIVCVVYSKIVDVS